MLDETAAKALRDCLTNKGGTWRVKAKPPKSNTLAYAAYQAAMINWNPYKASVAAMLFMSPEQMDVYRAVDAFAAANMRLRGLDRDRLILETIGAW